MPGVQDNAEQVKEKAFQSMQDSLDKIEKNTSSLGSFTGTLEGIMEENKAQRLRDKEQEKQTKALEKMSGKNAKEGMSTWNKVLLGVLGLGIGIWAIHDLMKGRWPKLKALDPALDDKKRKKALEEMKDFDNWRKKNQLARPKMDPETGKLLGDRGRFESELFDKWGIHPGDVGEQIDAAATQIPKLSDLPRNIKIQAGRAGGLIKGLVQGPFEKFKRATQQVKKIAGLDSSHEEMKKQNREAEKVRNQKAEVEKAEKKAYREKEQREKKERKATKQKLDDLDKANKKAQRDAAAKAKDEAKAKNITKQQAYEAEQKRLKSIAQAKIDVKNAQDHAKKVTKVPPTKSDPLKTAKGNVRQGVNYVRSMAKGWTVFRTVGAVPVPGARFVAAVLSLGLIAADTWAQTEEGQLFLKELGWSKEQFLEELFEKGKKAKSFTSAPLDAAGIPKKQVGSTFGQVPPEPSMLSKIGSDIKKRGGRLGKFLWGKEDKPTKDQSLTDADFNAIRIPIGKRESEGAEGGPLRAKNKYGYRGKYQFGAQALESIGFLKAGTWKKGPRDNKKLMENSSNWVGGADKDGNLLPKSLEAYLSSEEMQDLAFHKNALFNRAVMRGKGGIGMETWNTLSKEERAFMVGAAHISGAQSTVSQFNRGDFGKKDAFGTESSVMGNIAARAVNKTGQALNIRPEMSGTGSGGATQVTINAPTSNNSSNAVVLPHGPHAPAIDNGLDLRGLTNN